jgi:hypothetical protein
MFMPDTIVFNGQEAPRGEKSFYWLYVTTKPDGSGSSGACDCRKKSGPTLGPFSTLHGGEWLSIEMPRRVTITLVPRSGPSMGKISPIPM